MDDETPIASVRSGAPASPEIAVLRTSSAKPSQTRPGRSAIVAFDRRELDAILQVYGRMVAMGEWRDYGLDHLSDRAVFSIFRRAGEGPLFRVEKEPRLARRQGAYSVIAASGHIMKRGHDLKQTLRVFDRMLLKLVAQRDA